MIEINIFKAQVMAKVERGVEEVVEVEGVAHSPARGVAKEGAEVAEVVVRRNRTLSPT